MKNVKGKILLTVNNSEIKEFLEDALAKQNFAVTRSDVNEVTKSIQAIHPDLIVLQMESGKGDVNDVCYKIKNHPVANGVKVIIFSEQEEEYLEATAFNAGANDYVIHPLRRPLALLGRIKSLLQNNEENRKMHIQNNGSHTLRIDQDSFAVFLDDESIDITKKEFDLLSLLSSKPGRLFTRKEIYQSIWKKDVVSDRTIDVHIRRLRIKIGDNFIATQKGVGYRFSL